MYAALIALCEAETLGKTPGLGAIPGIGRAFRHKGKASVSSELLVFVTPTSCRSATARGQIAAELSGVKVLCLPMHGAARFVEAALEAGASGYLLSEP